MKNPYTPNALKTLLTQEGIFPSRRLGQNFLIDTNWIQKTIFSTGAQRGSKIVEIGPGMGALTHALLLTGAEVWAIELDHRIFRILEGNLASKFDGDLHLIQGDAVQFPKAGIPSDANYIVVANLPYSIISPWLDALLRDDGTLPKDLHLIVQKEAADRLEAPSCSKEYGPMSIRLQLAFEMKNSITLPPRAFYPEPHVESRLIHWTLKPDARILSVDCLTFLKKAFLHRRKKIGKMLTENLSDRIIERWKEALCTYGLDTNARAEEIPIGGWAALHTALESE